MTKDLQDHTFTAFIMNEDLPQCMLNFLEIEMHEPFLLDYGYTAAAQQSTTTQYKFELKTLAYAGMTRVTKMVLQHVWQQDS